MPVAFEFTNADAGAGSFCHSVFRSLSLRQDQFAGSRDPQIVDLPVELDAGLHTVLDQVARIVGRQRQLVGWFYFGHGIHEGCSK